MPAAGRIGDPISCGDTMAQGSPTVFVNGIPFSRATDKTAGHCYGSTPLVGGSPDVFVNGLAAGNVGTPIAPHTCVPIPDTHGGSLAVGSPDVNVN